MRRVAFCLLCWVGLAQSVAALDRGTFGPFVLSLNDTRHGYQVVRDPTGAAPSKQVERFEVRPGDCNRNGGWDDQRGLRFARIRCNVRRCMFSRRAVSLTLRSQSS